MREATKTVLFFAAAMVLAAAAVWVQPERVDPGIFSDQGETLFPAFTDADAVKSVEIIDYDAATATARPFKVEWRRNQWVIPSHNDYPSDAAGQLAKTAAALIGVRKDLVVSDLIEDHARYGVIDPLDARAASLSGRGKRVTLRGERGDVLADFILGGKPEDKGDHRYLRLPEQKRVYAVKTDADPSADFRDWVETDLLKLTAAALRRITILNYSLDEMSGRLLRQERIVLVKSGNEWTFESGSLPRARIQRVVDALTALRITGVQPKSPELARGLRDGQLAMSLETMLSLRQRGFYLTPTGQLLSNEGEIIVELDNGLVYQIRFGEIVTGVTSSGGGEEEAAEARADRFIFLTLRHDAERARKYGASESASSAAERRARQLNARFADWFYIISGEDFTRLRPGSGGASRAPQSTPPPAPPAGPVEP